MATSRIQRLRALFLELPQQLRLAYCLVRDPRTPAAPKAALGAALLVILNPLVDIPLWVPLVGQMDTIGLALITVRTFNAQVPVELRAELESQIRARDSVFDRDLAVGTAGAKRLAKVVRSVPRVSRGGGGHPAPSEPAPWYRSPSAAAGAEGAGEPPPGAEESDS